jgi:subtilisin-like proprotein convertase family protein
LVGSGQGAAQAAQPAPSPSLTLTSAQHLAEAKKALADGYKPHNDPQKARWGEVAAAKWHLKAIDTTAPEYREAQELLKEVARRERQVELAKKKAESNKGSDEATAADAAEDDSDEASSATPSSPTSSPKSASTEPRQSPPVGTAGGGSSNDYYTNSRGVQVQRPTFSENGPPPGATAQCRDGSYSFSQSRRGTCSHHGGVARWL